MMLRGVPPCEPQQCGLSPFSLVQDLYRHAFNAPAPNAALPSYTTNALRGCVSHSLKVYCSVSAWLGNVNCKAPRVHQNMATRQAGLELWAPSTRQRTAQWQWGTAGTGAAQAGSAPPWATIRWPSLALACISWHRGSPWQGCTGARMCRVRARGTHTHTHTHTEGPPPQPRFLHHVIQWRRGGGAQVDSGHSLQSAAVQWRGKAVGETSVQRGPRRARERAGGPSWPANAQREDPGSHKAATLPTCGLQ